MTFRIILIPALLLFSTVNLAAEDTKEYVFNLQHVVKEKLAFDLLIPWTTTNHPTESTVDFDLVNIHDVVYKQEFFATLVQGARIKSTDPDHKFDLELKRSSTFSNDGKSCSETSSCPDLSTVGLTSQTPQDHKVFDAAGLEQTVIKLEGQIGNKEMPGFVIRHKRKNEFPAGTYTEQWVLSITPAI